MSWCKYALAFKHYAIIFIASGCLECQHNENGMYHFTTENGNGMETFLCPLLYINESFGGSLSSWGLIIQANNPALATKSWRKWG